MTRRVIVTLAVLALLIVGLAQLQSWRHDAAERRAQSSGSDIESGLTLFKPADRPRAPDLTGRTLDGGRYALADQIGHLVVVNIWGSWCGPCRAETPDLVRLAGAYRSRGVRFLGIDTRDEKTAARAFVRRFEVPYPSLIDDGGELMLRLRGVVPLAVVPSTFVVDPSGRVAARVIGRITAHTLRGILDDELEVTDQGGG